MMQRYDPHHPQVVASQPHDGFYFEPVTSAIAPGKPSSGKS
ncbi:hypothetical protein [Silvania confinis]|nr:hypothetical protein [Silvania confinis]